MKISLLPENPAGWPQHRFEELFAVERGERLLELRLAQPIVGSIGSPQRLEFTAIGSTVNRPIFTGSMSRSPGVDAGIGADVGERLA